MTAGPGDAGVSGRLAGLSQEKRALLERALLARRRPEEDQQIPRRDRATPGPLSFPQQRLWFFDRLAPGNPTYNACVAMGLVGPVDVERLRAGFDAAVRRHEVLRTVFPDDDGVPFQHVLDEWRLELPVVDLTAVPAAQRPAAALQLMADESRKPYDLEADLMMRLLLVRVGDDEHVLAIFEHHIAFDGWSDEILCAEVSEVYRALGEGRAPVVPDLPVQYGDFAAWQQARLAGDRLAKLHSFWRDYLAGIPGRTPLPVDTERPPRQTFEGARVYVDIPADVLVPLTALCRAESATPFMVLLATFDALLMRWSGAQDITVGTPIANRSRVELERLIGFFSNTLVVRARPTPEMTVREFVRHVRESALGAFQHQDLPFDRIVEAVQPARDPSYNPLFQVNFRVTSGDAALLDLPGVVADAVAVDVGFARFDLALELQQKPDGLGGYLEYNVALFSDRTARALVEAFSALLAAALREPDTALGDLEMSAAPAGRGIRGARGRR